MTRWEARTLYVANLLVGGTGIVYAVMRYLMEPADEWAVVNHPWQPHVQHLHILVAPLLVFACGLIWRGHVATKIRNGNGNGNGNGKGNGRRSGPGLLLALAPMVLSGYLIQTTVAESWRQVWTVLHLVSSGVWIVVFVSHLRKQLMERMRSR